MIEDKRLKLPDYVPVPVEAAKQIAVQFQKQMVVIIATDNVHQQTNYTSYGVSPEEKVEAAVTAEFLSKQMGNVPEANKFSEDFRRDMDAAKYKAAMELIESCQKVLTEYLVPDGASEKDTLNKLLGLLDGPRSRAVQGGAK